MSTNSTKSSGVGIPTVLFIVFAVLQLVGVIAWSWWWITAPLWISCVLWFALVFFVAFVQAIAKPKPVTRKYRP